MRTVLNIWVIGGDRRQGKLAECLAEEGHTVHTFAMEEGGALEGVWAEETLHTVALADCVILPLPTTGEGSLLHAPLSARDYPLVELLNRLRPEQVICGGMIDGRLTQMASERGLMLHDYFEREELAIANAVPTVEGALQIAMEELPITLHRAHALVVGYGRLGKLLSHRLAGLGARVSVAARSYTDLAWISALGYGVERTDQLRGWLCGYDLIINTVPAQVLDEETLLDVKPNCLVIDLASKPGGVDFDTAAALGVRVIWALSLPGKVAPVTAGESIKTAIYNILHELGV